MQVTTSVAIMQVFTFCCNHAGGTFCYSYFGYLFVAVMEVTVQFKYGVRSFCSTYASDSFCSKNVGDNFYCNYAGGNYVAITQVVFSAVYYALDYFYSNYAGDCSCYTVVTMWIAVSSNNFIFCFLTDTHFS